MTNELQRSRFNMNKGDERVSQDYSLIVHGLVSYKVAPKVSICI